MLDEKNNRNLNSNLAVFGGFGSKGKGFGSIFEPGSKGVAVQVAADIVGQ